MDAQKSCRTDLDPLDLQREGADNPDAKADLTSSPQGSPDGMPSAIQHQVMLRNGDQVHTASGEAVEDDEGEDAADEGEEDDEEWEPAPTRTELLRNAVQYLQQASAGQGAADEAEKQQDEAPAQVCKQDACCPASIMIGCGGIESGCSPCSIGGGRNHCQQCGACNSLGRTPREVIRAGGDHSEQAGQDLLALLHPFRWYAWQRSP